MTLDFNTASLLLAVACLTLTLPIAYLAFRAPYVPRPVAIMLTFVLVALTVAGVVGAMGRLVDRDPFLDRTVRISLIALRVFAIGGLLNVILELNKARKLPPLHRRIDDD